MYVIISIDRKEGASKPGTSSCDQTYSAILSTTQPITPIAFASEGRPFSLLDTASLMSLRYGHRNDRSLSDADILSIRVQRLSIFDITHEPIARACFQNNYHGCGNARCLVTLTCRHKCRRLISRSIRSRQAQRNSQSSAMSLYYL